MKDLSKTKKSLNEMSLHERMEYQRVHDRAIILQAAMKDSNIELKTLTDKRKHPLAIENTQNN